MFTDATPMAVFTKVAHIEHSPTDINDMINELSLSEFLVKVFTIIKTSNNHTTGDTGLRIWIIQLIDPLKVSLNPKTIPTGTAKNSAKKKPANTVF